jgi:hypothetical protein
MEETGYEIPSEYDVKITTPSGQVSTLSLKVGCRNKITAADLFVSKDNSCLEDGIYCFETESCGVKYKINKAYLCNLRCSLDRVIANTDNIDKYVKYSALYESIRSNAELGNKLEADKIYNYLSRELENYNCEKC